MTIPVHHLSFLMSFFQASRMNCPPAIFASGFCDSQILFPIIGLNLAQNKNNFNAMQILHA